MTVGRCNSTGGGGHLRCDMFGVSVTPHCSFDGGLCTAALFCCTLSGGGRHTFIPVANAPAFCVSKIKRSDGDTSTFGTGRRSLFDSAGVS